jgi:hypothetical protein
MTGIPRGTSYSFGASHESDDECSGRLEDEVAEEASLPPCKDGGRWVDADGSCLRCGADQGVECPMKPKSK